MYVLHTIYDLNILFYAINPIKHTFSKIQQETRLLLCVSRKARKTSGVAMCTKRDAGTRDYPGISPLPTMFFSFVFGLSDRNQSREKVLHPRIKHDTWSDFY